MDPAYRYSATVVRWVDGDTVDLRVDCGFYITVESRFRLYGIDTPERGHTDYAAAAAMAYNIAPPGSTVTARTFKAPDKYGRWLATLWVGDTSVNQSLLDHALAVPYFGGSKSK